MKNILFTLLACISVSVCYTQNTGLGTSIPVGKLHIKGTADIPQLIIDANTTQSNTQPLLKLRTNAGSDLMTLHSDDVTNVFIGINTGRLNSVAGGGQRNVFIGTSSGSNNQTGYLNTGIGWTALNDNVGGHGNSAYGATALTNNNSGNENTGLGAGSMYDNFSGSSNTAIGTDALRHTTGSNTNTAVGYRAGYTYNNGWNNVFIGAGADAAGADYYNVVAIGQGTIATAPSQVRLGNSSTTTFFCQGIYASTTSSAANVYVNSSGQVMRSTSSARYKTNITDLDINTQLLYQLRPVSYISRSDNSNHFGLIAEEVANVIPQLAEYAMEKDVIPGSTSEKLIPDAVQYPLLSVLLLKELQNQKILIDQLQKEISLLKTRIK